MAPKFGYWALKGLGHTCRLTLAYAGVEHEDEVYTNMKQWKDKKFNLGLTYPNLPYYIDGDLNLTQSGAIIRHIGRKHGLYGKDDNERALVDMTFDTGLDVLMGMVMICYNPNFENMKADWSKTAGEKLAVLDKELGDKDWFVGNSVTIGDLSVYTAMIFNLELCPEVVKKNANLMAFKERLEALPKIKEFLASDKNFEALCGPTAEFAQMKEH